MKRLFFYIEPLWLGKNGKVSIRSTLAISFSIHFMVTFSHAVDKWNGGQSLSDLALILGIEGSMIGVLLGLRTWQNMQYENRGGGGYYNNNFSNIQQEEVKGTAECSTE